MHRGHIGRPRCRLSYSLRVGFGPWYGDRQNSACFERHAVGAGRCSPAAPQLPVFPGREAPARNNADLSRRGVIAGGSPAGLREGIG
jgi:hypothetical protein